MNESSGGGSTLSQQLAKNLFPRKSYWLASMPVNKFREMITAQRLEKIYTKEELLNLYLNTVPFGGTIYGINVASQTFYGKKPTKLSIAEAALLVGMLKGPSLYNPVNHPERALKRRNTVLSQMVKYNYLT
jgi:penicillin-binding protein 1A